MLHARVGATLGGVETQLSVPFDVLTHSRTNFIGNFLGPHSVDLSAQTLLF